MKEMFTKKDRKAKAIAEGDEDSLDINGFEKLVEGNVCKLNRPLIMHFLIMYTNCII
jgi:hypothetical protein